MRDSEWLQNLGAGDTVAVAAGSGYGSRDRLTTVERFTKTLIITTDGSRFRRSDGRTMGGGYHGQWLERPTQERKDAIRQALLAVQFRHIKWADLPLATLEAVKNLLPKTP